MSRIESIKNAKSYIGKRGYIMRKSHLTEEEIKDIKNDLTVKPFTNNDYGVQEESFKIYLENESKLYLPKSYGIEKFGNPDINILPEGKDIDIDFTLELKEEQKIPAEKTMEAYKNQGGGILSLPCGFGKTILGLYFIAQLKKKTLVIVHKEFLMNQWIERIQFAIPNAKVGIIQGDKFQVEGKDIVIGMLQTLSMKDFSDDSFDDFGHVIIDECHTIPSRVFSKALMKVNSKYSLGISATPKRNDGMMKVLIYHIGNIFYCIKSNQKNTVKVERYLLDSSDVNYNNEVLNFRNKPQMANMINNIADYTKRSKLIIDKVLSEIKLNDKRQFLILSDRRQQLEYMFKIINELSDVSCGYYIGGLKKNVLKDNEKCKILLGTYPMASTGLDIPSLNGLVLATPRSDIIQSIGRIDRIVHVDIEPLIIDMCDQFSIFENQCKKRFAVFKKKKYNIQDISYNLDNNTVKITKNYFFHNCITNNDSDSDENINISEDEIDTEYTNINSKTNQKIRKNTKNKDKPKDENKKLNEECEDLFQKMKNISFFK